LDIVGYLQLENSILFSRIILSNSTVIILLETLICNLLMSFLAFLIAYRRYNHQIRIISNVSIEKVTKYILIILAPFVIMDGIIKFYFIQLNGYLALFNGMLISGEIFQVLAYITRIYKYIFFIYLSSGPSYKSFKLMSSLFVLVSLLDIISGKRGHALILLILVLWYNYNYFSKKIRLIKIGLISTFIILISQFALILRSGISSSGIFQTILTFFELNGISVYVLGYIIELGDSLKNEGMPYFLSPIYDFFLRIIGEREIFYRGNTVELLENTNYLGHELTYVINRNAFFQGNGTGSSYIAELYHFGGIVVVGLVTFLLIYFVISFEKRIRGSNIRFIVYLTILYRFMYMPRDSFLKFVPEIIPIIIIYFLIKSIVGKNSTSQVYPPVLG
jgi:oligosaccharide repeat unit polymerase